MVALAKHARVLSPIALVATFAGLIAAQPTTDPLAGPTISDQTDDHPESLVRVGYDGLIRPPEAPPAIAALRLLDLTDEERQPIDELLGERWTIFDRLVREHALLLAQIEPVMTAGGGAEKAEVIREGLVALQPVRASGRLRDRLGAALPPEKRPRYASLLAEYDQAFYEQMRRTGEADGPWAYRMKRYWDDIAWELERAAERVFQEEDTDGLATLVERLELSTDQEARIRTMAEAAYIESGGFLSKDEEQRLFTRILDELQWDQRLKLLGMALRGELDKNDEMNP